LSVSAEPAEVKARWMSAYEVLEKATRAETDKMPAQALSLYRESEKLFREVRSLSPRWNPSLVNYRISHCLKQIDRLETLVQSLNTSLTKEELLKQNKTQAEDLKKAREQNQAFQHQLRLTGLALDKAREEAARSLLSADEAAALVKENKALQLKLRQAENGSVRLREEIRQWRDGKRVEELRLKLEQDLNLAQLRQNQSDSVLKTRDQDLERLKSRLEQMEKDKCTLLVENRRLQLTIANHEKLLNLQAQDLLTRSTANTPPAATSSADAQLLNALQNKNHQLTTSLRLARQEQQKRQGAIQKLTDQLRQQQAQLQEQQTHAKNLAKRLRTQISLLQQQEKHMAQLSQGKQAVQPSSDEARPDSKDLASLRLKAEAVTGLTQNLQEARAQNLQAQSALEQTKTALAASRQNSEEYRLRLQEREHEISQLRQSLLTLKSQASNSNGEALLTQIRQLTTKLEQERQRSLALEKALEHPPTANASPAQEVATATVNRKSEAQRRLNETNILADSYLRQGFTAEEKHNLQAAIWNYKKSLTLTPNNKTALQRLGLIAAENGDEQSAELYLNRTFKLDPDDLDTLIPLGFCLTRQGKVDLALSMLTRAVALDSQNPATHRALGVACSSLGWHDAAEAQFRRALKLNPQDSETAFNLAILLATQGPANLDEARKWYQLARNLNGASDPGLDKLFGLN
jgi:Flp pilus assembly protein TadD